MKIISRYIAKHIISATVLVSLVISALLLLLTLLGELKSVGTGDYGMQEAIWYAVLSLPNKIYEFSPILILLSCILGVSQLNNHQELIVMRSSGMSLKKLMLTIIGTGLLIIICLGFVGEVLGKNLSYQAEVHKENQRNAGQAVVTASGVWFHIDNNFIHIKNIIGKRLLEGVTRYQFDEARRLQVAYYSKRLELINNQWQMQEVVLTKFQNDATTTQQFQVLPWELKINPNLFTIGLVEPMQMSLSRLLKFSKYLNKNNLQAKEYEFNFWQRIFQPVTTLIMIMLALPFILTVQKGNNLGKRMLLGTVIGFSFFIINAILGQLTVVYQLPIIISAAIPSIFFVLIFCVVNKCTSLKTSTLSR